MTSIPPSLHSLLFGGDFHLDANQYGLPVREEDYRRAFTTFFDEAERIPHADVVLLGDTSEIPNERHNVIHLIRQNVARVVASGRTVYYLAGNHDGASPSLPVAVGVAGFVDAEAAFLQALADGRTFQPYGPDGPKVAAFHATTPDILWAKLDQVRALEKSENRSTELWLHQAIAPGARTGYAEFEAADFINRGWHTLLAGDIHKGGISKVRSNAGDGLLVYPDSPEMTDITEEQGTRGFILHTPVDSEPAMDAGHFARIAYRHRPYRTFDFTGKIQSEEVDLVVSWIRQVTEESGMTPIVRICSPDANWRGHRSLLPLCLKLLYKRPDIVRPDMVPTASAELTLDGMIGGGNASVYGSVYGGETIYDKLQRILALSTLSPESKALGSVVLTNPTDSSTWLRAVRESEQTTAVAF